VPPPVRRPGAALRLVASLEGPVGAPVLVLGNSIGTTRAVWDRQAAALREHFRLLRFEYPGHDGSAAPPGPYSIGDLAGGVLAQLDAHEIGRALYCGISLGGMVGPAGLARLDHRAHAGHRGRRGPRHPAVARRRHRGRISGSRLRVIGGASHLANVSAPGEVTAAVLGHLLAVR